jgi:hypothetical protein
VNPQGFRWIRLSTRLAIYARDEFRCLACDLEGSWQKQGRRGWHSMRPSALSLDHVISKLAGGSNRPDNLVTLCVGCNSSRQESLFVDWRPDLMAKLWDAISTPIDRAHGLSLAKALDPKWALRESAHRRAA